MRDLQPTPKKNPHPGFYGKDKMVMPAGVVPSYNAMVASKNGGLKNYLINAWGGLGDQICAEPAIRYALETFKSVDISLAGRIPSLFSHLNFKQVFDTREENPDWDDFLVYNTILPAEHLFSEFVSHMTTHCVEYHAICMWRTMLPAQYRSIELPAYRVPLELGCVDLRQCVVVHPGKHWPTKTFPKQWWEDVIKAIQRRGLTAIVIGQQVDENVGYVPVEGEFIDLRDKLDIPGFIGLLTACKALLTNDSSPIHAAAAGQAFIGFIASCKRPAYLYHWRNGVFGWNMKNFGKDGVWNHIDVRPARHAEPDLRADQWPEGLVAEDILPDPEEVADAYEENHKSLIESDQADRAPVRHGPAVDGGYGHRGVGS